MRIIIQNSKTRGQESKVVGVTDNLETTSTGFRMEVVALAVLFFMQSISPVFVQAAAPVGLESMVKTESTVKEQGVGMYPEIPRMEVRGLHGIEPCKEIQPVETPDQKSVQRIRIPGDRTSRKPVVLRQ